MNDIRTETKKRQDDARDTGKAAEEAGASDELKEHLKEDMTEDEKDEFDKGVNDAKNP